MIKYFVQGVALSSQPVIMAKVAWNSKFLKKRDNGYMVTTRTLIVLSKGWQRNNDVSGVSGVHVRQ